MGEMDLEIAKLSFENENYKWATIQAYYSILHAVKAIVLKEVGDGRSKTSVKDLFKKLYIENNKLPSFIYNCLENGMKLNKMAQYKNTYSKKSAESIIVAVILSLREIKEQL